MSTPARSPVANLLQYASNAFNEIPPKNASTVFPFEAVGIVRFGAAVADAEAAEEEEEEEAIEQSFSNNVVSVRDSEQTLRLSPPSITKSNLERKISFDALRANP